MNYAEKVLRMDRHNEQVVTAYMLLKDGFNKVVREVSRILPEIDPAPAPNNMISPRNEQ
ncbi:hypothetical protein LWM68_40730 [Niabella sp. W65]|nr:hypothetical protein [Niabella sp. W65]MCH7368499.1 hypothetical protein [Niabella sp. W65]